jgi:hypothetical protein
MKTNINYLILFLLFSFVSCVQLPDLLPNGSGEDNDMVIVELNEILGASETITINDSLDLVFFRNETEVCPGLMLKITNGNILAAFNDTKVPVELTEGDLVGGFVEGTWSNRVLLNSGMEFFPGCVYLPIISVDQDVIVGIRFKSNANKTHYGWMVLRVDSTSGNNDYQLKAVGYNKQSGVNVRIGN